MVFGFSGAIVAGFILTALPGWAGTEEIRGWRLALLVLAWLSGRGAVYGGEVIPAYGIMILDSSLFCLTGIMLLPGLLRAKNKHYLALLPILGMLCSGNVIFHLAIIDGDMARASWGIQIGLMGVIAKFILAGGFLTTVFTRNALRQKNGPDLKVLPWLEYLSALSLMLFIYGVLADVPERIGGLFAFCAAAVQMGRFLRWRSFLILDAPLVLFMHVSYLWFIGAMILYGAGTMGAEIGTGAWIHAFTVGALSLMMLSLITRVTLRHTGRRLVPGKFMITAFVLMVGAAALRVMVPLRVLSEDWLSVSAMIWVTSFGLYIILHGLLLIRPSLPRENKPKSRAIERSS